MRQHYINNIIKMAKASFEFDNKSIQFFEKLLREHKLDNECETIDNECSSCEFWTAYTREESCSQKVKLHMNKWDTQITLETYGCNTWEERI